MRRPADQPLDRLALWEDSVERDGPEQMACDEALLERAEMPVLRVFRWKNPWVSIGYFTPLEAAERVCRGLPVCRRWTGGGIVVHEGDFTFSLTVPRGEALAAARPAESYRRLHLALAAALREAGTATALAAGSASAPAECFAGPVEHDLVAGGTKIAGGAQRRTRHGLLHQGSVQTSRPLGSGFGRLLAATLNDSVAVWVPPEGWEDEVKRLAAGKYRSPDFLRGPARPKNFTAVAAS